MGSPDYLFEESEKAFNFNYYLSLFRKRLSFILTFFLLALTLGVFYASHFPNHYEAISKIEFLQVDQPKTKDEERFLVLENIRSEEILFPVVSHLKLEEYYNLELKEAVRYLRSRIFLMPEKSGREVSIKVRDIDPQMAADIANEIARTYVRKNFENTFFRSEEMKNWLPDSEWGKKTVDFRDLPGGETVRISRNDFLESLPAFQDDVQIKEWNQQKEAAAVEVETLKRRYRSKHPLMIKAVAHQAYIEENLEKGKKRIFEMLQEKASSQSIFPPARFLKEAKAPHHPAPGRRLEIIAIIAFSGLLLSFLLIILIDSFDFSIRSVEDLERSGIHFPFLGHLSKLKKSRRRKKSPTAEFFELAEAFRYVRVAINFSTSPENLKVLLFSSCLPSEGKTFTAQNIAISLAMDGNKTLLVDANFRNPAIHKRFQQENKKGLSDFLAGKADFEDILQDTLIENLVLVTSGTSFAKSQEILGSENMKKFLDQVRTHFDRVIIDSAALTGIGDTYPLAGLLGQIILVISSGKTSIDLIRQNQKQLEKSGVKIMGVILNQVSVQTGKSGQNEKYYPSFLNKPPKPFPPAREA